MSLDATLTRAALLEAIGHLVPVAKRPTPTAILQCALLTVTDGSLTARATDTITEVETTVSVASGKPGVVAVRCVDLYDRIKAMPAGDVQLRVKDDTLQILAKGSKRKHELKMLPAGDFPPSSSASDIDGAEVNGSDFAEVIGRGRLFADQDRDNAAKNTVWIDISKGHASVIGACNYGFSRATGVVSAVDCVSMSVPIPQATAVQIGQWLCTAAFAKARVAMVGTAFHIIGSGIRVTSRTVDVQRLPIDQVIGAVRKAVTTRISVPRAACLEALRSAALSTGAKGEIRMVIEGGTMAIASLSETAASSDEVDVEGDAGPARVAVVAKYIADVLGNAGDERMTVGFGSELDGITFDAAGFEAVVMPLKY